MALPASGDPEPLWRHVRVGPLPRIPPPSVEGRHRRSALGSVGGDVHPRSGRNGQVDDYRLGGATWVFPDLGSDLNEGPLYTSGRPISDRLLPARGKRGEGNGRFAPIAVILHRRTGAAKQPLATR